MIITLKDCQTNSTHNISSSDMIKNIMTNYSTKNEYFYTNMIYNKQI